MIIASIASALIGAAVGLIAVAIFAIILRRVEQSRPDNAIRTLVALISVVLGGGFVDYVVFDVIIDADGAIFYYMIGLTAIFLPLGLFIFVGWHRRSDDD